MDFLLQLSNRPLEGTITDLPNKKRSEAKPITTPLLPQIWTYLIKLSSSTDRVFVIKMYQAVRHAACSVVRRRVISGAWIPDSRSDVAFGAGIVVVIVKRDKVGVGTLDGSGVTDVPGSGVRA